MLRSISFELTPLYLIPGIALALFIAYLIYSRPFSWSKKLNQTLFAIRFLLAFSLFFLLLSPLLKQIHSRIEKPKVVLGIDNSESIGNTIDSLRREQIWSQLDQLLSLLERKDYDVEIRTLDGIKQQLSAIEFDQPITNLNKWLRQIESDYEGTNLSQVYLLSDGNYNQGSSPAYFPFSFPINTIGVGDTTQKEDLSIKQVLYNKIAYQGNLFPVYVEVVNYGFSGQSSVIEIYQGGNLVDSEQINFLGTNRLQRAALEVPADESGYVRLEVRVRALDGEEIIENNRRTIFVDIVDGKQKILLTGPAPHPDMRAMIAVIQKNQNYELVTHIAGINNFKEDKYDLAIVHQAYDRLNRTRKIIDKMKQDNVPVIEFLGALSNLNAANKAEVHLSILQQRNQRDQVVGSLNKGFSQFTLTDITDQVLGSFPPITVPFGDYQITSASNVLLHQKIGSVSTLRPLMYVVEENETKMAFVIGDNYWKWRMQEYAMTENTLSFDQLFLKLFQYMSTKVDKRKFRFYPTQNEFLTNETVKFQTEIYNDIFERTFGQEVEVRISNSQGFVKELVHHPISEYDQLELGGLKEGAYQYEASFSTDDKANTNTLRGEFVVNALQLESIDQVADHDLLRRLSANTGGVFSNQNFIDFFSEDLDAKSFKGLIHTDEDILPLIYIKWIFFILLTLVSIEWFARKYSGGY